MTVSTALHPGEDWAILDGARAGHTLILGDAGTGKSTDLMQILERQLPYDQPLILMAGNHQPLAHHARDIMPRNRDVLWVDPGDPACPWALGGLKPLEPDKQAIDMARVWREHQVLLVYLDEKKLGRGRAGVWGRLLLDQLRNVLIKAVSPTTRGLLLIDEATYLLEAPGMALAERGLSWGLRLAVAAQTRDVMSSPIVRWSLLGNARHLIAHRMTEPDAAQYTAAHLHVSSKALRHLPPHTALCVWDRQDRGADAVRIEFAAPCAEASR